MAQANQELQALYSELINRMKQGVEMHEQLADYYAFSYSIHFLKPSFTAVRLVPPSTS